MDCQYHRPKLRFDPFVNDVQHGDEYMAQQLLASQQQSSLAKTDRLARMHLAMRVRSSLWRSSPCSRLGLDPFLDQHLSVRARSFRHRPLLQCRLQDHDEPRATLLRSGARHQCQDQSHLARQVLRPIILKQLASSEELKTPHQP